jgi:hypothetical protein
VDTWSWRNCQHFAKGDFAVFMKKRLDDAGELAVPNLGDNISQLNAWHKCQKMEPIFQWELAENLHKVI